MMKLIQEAQELIIDHPEESKVVYWALSLDDEARQAFMLAWNLIYNNDEEG